jgi:hypothetical protein
MTGSPWRVLKGLLWGRKQSVNLCVHGLGEEVGRERFLLGFELPRLIGDQQP